VEANSIGEHTQTFMFLFVFFIRFNGADMETTWEYSGSNATLARRKRVDEEGQEVEEIKVREHLMCKLDRLSGAFWASLLCNGERPADNLITMHPRGQVHIKVEAYTTSELATRTQQEAAVTAAEEAAAAALARPDNDAEPNEVLDDVYSWVMLSYLHIQKGVCVQKTKPSPLRTISICVSVCE
jgi:hypothetical protein